MRTGDALGRGKAAGAFPLLSALPPDVGLHKMAIFSSLSSLSAVLLLTSDAAL